MLIFFDCNIDVVYLMGSRTTMRQIIVWLLLRVTGPTDDVSILIFISRQISKFFSLAGIFPEAFAAGVFRFSQLVCLASPLGVIVRKRGLVASVKVSQMVMIHISLALPVTTIRRKDDLVIGAVQMLTASDFDHA